MGTSLARAAWRRACPGRRGPRRPDGRGAPLNTDAGVSAHQSIVSSGLARVRSDMPTTAGEPDPPTMSREREHLLATLLESLPVVVFRLDRELRHLYVNSA